MTYPLVPTTRQIDPGTTFAIRLAVPIYQLRLEPREYSMTHNEP
jgi:hypothetical protein